jgi:hypothetical protein
MMMRKEIQTRGSQTHPVLLHTTRVDNAGWSSPVARQAHNLKVVSSNLAPATNRPRQADGLTGFSFLGFGPKK